MIGLDPPGLSLGPTYSKECVTHTHKKKNVSHREDKKPEQNQGPNRKEEGCVRKDIR